MQVQLTTIARRVASSPWAERALLLAAVAFFALLSLHVWLSAR